jgi:hypothetical protein
MDTFGMQRRHNGLAPKRAVVSVKQGKCQQGSETDHSAGGRQASSQVFHLDSKNECQAIVEESAPIQTKEETTSSLRARDVGAPATLRSFARTDRKKKMAICL